QEHRGPRHAAPVERVTEERNGWLDARSCLYGTHRRAQVAERIARHRCETSRKPEAQERWRVERIVERLQLGGGGRRIAVPRAGPVAAACRGQQHDAEPACEREVSLHWRHGLPRVAGWFESPLQPGFDRL